MTKDTLATLLGMSVDELEKILSGTSIYVPRRTPILPNHFIRAFDPGMIFPKLNAIFDDVHLPPYLLWQDTDRCFKTYGLGTHQIAHHGPSAMKWHIPSNLNASRPVVRSLRSVNRNR